MVFACGRYMDDLALHGFHKGRIFPFWVYDDHIGIGVCQYDVRHFFLCRKGFSCTRHTEDKRISIQEVSAVGDNHIFADDILTVIYAVFMVDFLHTERDKYRKALRCQGTQGVNPPYAERQSRVQTVHLLVFQHRKLAQMLSGCREQGFGIAVKLLFGVGGMHHREDRKHHPLVTGRQIIKENTEAMLQAIEHVKTGQITYAVRDTRIDDKEIHEGDMMGIGDHGILAVGKDRMEVAKETVAQMVDDESEVISIYYGADTEEAEAEELATALEEAYPDCDVELNAGGQPIYYYVISVE